MVRRAGIPDTTRGRSPEYRFDDIQVFCFSIKGTICSSRVFK